MVKAIDLLAFARALPETAKLRRLRGLIEDTSDVHSAYTDLKTACDFASHAIELANGSDLPRELIDNGTMAFVAAAIVYYARATNSRSRHRKTFDIRKSLDDRELKAHELICALRDDAIAHYGPGELGPESSLRRDFVFLPEDGQQVMMVSRQMAQNTSLAHLIRRQSQRVLILTLRQFYEREARMVSALNAEVAANETIRNLAQIHAIDLQDVFGDPETTASALAEPRAGTRRISGE